MFGDATCETLHERVDAAREARRPRLLDQEEPDQEGPERGEDDGEGRRRGPHGLRRRSRSSRASSSGSTGWFAPGKPVLVTGRSAPRCRSRAAAPAGARGRERVEPIEIIAREIQPLEGMKEQGAREVLIAPSNFDTFDETPLMERSSGGSPARCPSFSKCGDRASLRRRSEALVAFWVRPDAGVHGVDGDASRRRVRSGTATRRRHDGPARSARLRRGRPPAASSPASARPPTAARWGSGSSGARCATSSSGARRRTSTSPSRPAPRTRSSSRARLAALPGWSLKARHERFGTATLEAPGGLRVDLAATRREEYPAPASLPVDHGNGDDRRGPRAARTSRSTRWRAASGSAASSARPLDPFGGKRTSRRRPCASFTRNPSSTTRRARTAR